jgi:hypothetical protein
MSKKIFGLMGALTLGACCCPAGIYRELRSDTSPPTAVDLVGTWRVTPESAARAAATGLRLDDIQSGFITFSEDGTCSGSIYPGVCGHSPTVKRKPEEKCRWNVTKFERPTIGLTFGEGRAGYFFDMHRLQSDPPILWQYICDPDWAEYLEYRRAKS